MGKVCENGDGDGDSGSDGDGEDVEDNKLPLVTVQLLFLEWTTRGRGVGSTKVTEEETDLPTVGVPARVAASSPRLPEVTAVASARPTSSSLSSGSSSPFADPLPLSYPLLAASLAAPTPLLLPLSSLSALARAPSALPLAALSCCLILERVSLLCFAGVGGVDGTKGGGTGIVARI